MSSTLFIRGVNEYHKSVLLSPGHVYQVGSKQAFKTRNLKDMLGHLKGNLTHNKHIQSLKYNVISLWNTPITYGHMLK